MADQLKGPGCPVELAYPGSALGITAAWEEIRGCCLAQHMIFTDMKEKMGQEECVWYESVPFSSWRACRRGEASPSPLCFHLTVWPLISGRSWEDRHSAPPPAPSSLFTWLSVTCVKMNSRFQGGMSLGTQARGVSGHSGPMMSSAFPRKAACSPPGYRWCQDAQKRNPRRDIQAQPSPRVGVLFQ